MTSGIEKAKFPIYFPLTFCVQHAIIASYLSSSFYNSRLPTGKFSEVHHRTFVFRKISHFSTIPLTAEHGSAGFTWQDNGKTPFAGKTKER